MRNHRLIASILLLVPSVALAQQQAEADDRRTLTVIGTGTIEREPERGVVMLAVESEAPTAREASEANAELMEAVIAAIRDAGIPEDDVRTESYQLNPVYRRPPTGQGGTPEIGAYRAVNMVETTVDDLDRLGRVIDAAIGAGANRVASLSFQLRDHESARRAALEEAVANARAEADAVAGASDQRLGQPLSISTSARHPIPPRPLALAEYAAADRAQAAETPIETGSLTIEATVTIVYELLSR